MLIVYRSYDEIIVCGSESEGKVVDEYFCSGYRDMGKFERIVYKTSVHVSSILQSSGIVMKG